MSTLWRWPELCAALGLEPRDGPDVSGICIDSRKAAPGDLFIALTGDPGPRFNPSQRSDRDGHDFIEAALAAGAVGVVAHDGAQRMAPQLQVSDTLDALWDLGRAARARFAGPVVAVTGSSGKTTTKGFLAAALGAFATSGSLNNHLGVPISLASTPRDASAAVYEIGTNHPGEIAPLAALAEPDVAVVLNVHPAHRENFSSMAALLSEKLSIYKGLRDKGHLVLEDLLDAGTVPAAVPVSRFGRADDARVQFLGLRSGDAQFRVGGRPITAHVPGGGEHRAMSLAAVLCVLDVLGRPLERALALPDSLIAPGRGRPQEVAGITIVDDSYNANPESMKAALAGLAGQPAARRYAVLGEMLELGADGAAHHRSLLEQTAGIDGVFCIGEGMRALHERLPDERACGWFAQAGDELLEALGATLGAGDVVLVKGSNRVFWARGFVQRLVESLG